MSRNLDTAIAEALGYEVIISTGLSRGEYLIRNAESKPKWQDLPHYSTDGNAMLELDREMRERGWFIREIFSFEHDVIVGYFHIEDDEMTDAATGHANTEPLARALAAYQALTGKVLNEVIK